MNDLIEWFLIFFIFYIFYSMWLISNILDKLLKNIVDIQKYLDERLD